MGKGDLASKNWLQDRCRYADLFNGIIFGGDQIISAEDLEEISGEPDVVFADKDGKAVKIQRYRDIVMRWNKEMALAVCACENQQNIHYAMPVRIMLYDGLSYTEQINQAWKRHENTEGNSKIDDAEWLSRFRKEDRLLPVISIVFYYGSEEWDAAVSLHDMLRFPESIEKRKLIEQYVPDYRINLVNAGKMEHIERFQTDLQVLFEMLKYRGEKEKLTSYVMAHRAYFENIDAETFWAFGEFLQAGKLWNKLIPRNKQNGGKIDMCKALQDLYDEGMERGMERGIERGMERGMERGRLDMLYELVSSGTLSVDLAAQKLHRTNQEILDGMTEAGFSIPI